VSKGGGAYRATDAGCWITGPVIGHLLLAPLFGLISRVTLVTRGVEIRRTGKSLHSVLPKAA